MKLKIILCLALVVSGVLAGCTSVKPSARLESSQSSFNFRQIYADASYRFGFAGYRGTEVLVFSQAHQQWKRIQEVSLVNSKLGHAPRTVSVNWDFAANYRGKEYAPLPLRTGKDGLSGYMIFPDKIEFDASRAVYLVWFNSVDAMDNDASVPTRVEISKKDLDEAFKKGPVTVGSVNANRFRWGEVVGGFQMASWLDEANGIVHCRIRNATTNEMDYPSFDFGYFENIRLEMQGATNRAKPWMMVFPRSAGYSSACPYFLKRIQPGQVVTETYTKSRFLAWPVLKHEEYQKWYPTNRNEALQAEALNQRASAREALLIKLCGDDTFALDLISEGSLPDFPEGESVEVRVSQEFRADQNTKATLYSPVFTLKASLLKTYAEQGRKLWGK